MTTPCACALNGVDPTAIGPGVIVTDVIEHPPEADLRLMTIAGRDGQRLTGSRTASLSVTVRFELHEPDPARRRLMCREVARWALPGGLLTLGDRPGQRLRVHCDAPPVSGSTLGWTEPVTVRFTAWEAPWWEDDTPVSVTAAAPAASGTLALRPLGDLPAALEASIANASGGVVDQVTLTCGGQSIALRGLNMGGGETLTLRYDERQLLRLAIGERSVLALRDPESADDLWLPPRVASQVRYAASGRVAVTLTARGRWL